MSDAAYGDDHREDLQRAMKEREEKAKTEMKIKNATIQKDKDISDIDVDVTMHQDRIVSILKEELHNRLDAIAAGNIISRMKLQINFRGSWIDLTPDEGEPYAVIRFTTKAAGT